MLKKGLKLLQALLVADSELNKLDMNLILDI
jgi:hypothetical protein